MPDGGAPADYELLRRHVAGDADAFGELFRRPRDRLWAAALRTVCDPDEAADALHAARPALSTGDEQAFEALVAQDGDPARTSDTRLDVDAALRLLPPQQRAALVLVDMLGFSVADTAAILDTSPGTVKSRCARARARLLPHLVHLQGNRSAGQSVSPAQGGDTA